MKVQYQLIDVETKKAIPVGMEFDLVDFMKEFFDKGEPISWFEASVLCGDPLSIREPLGILGESPITMARRSAGMEEL